MRTYMEYSMYSSDMTKINLINLHKPTAKFMSVSWHQISLPSILQSLLVEGLSFVDLSFHASLILISLLHFFLCYSFCLFFSLFIPVSYPSLFLSVCVSPSLSVCLFLSPSSSECVLSLYSTVVYPSCLSECMSVWMHQSVCLSICRMRICLSTSLCRPLSHAFQLLFFCHLP